MMSIGIVPKSRNAIISFFLMPPHPDNFTAVAIALTPLFSLKYRIVAIAATSFAPPNRISLKLDLDAFRTLLPPGAIAQWKAPKRIQVSC